MSEEERASANIVAIDIIKEIAEDNRRATYDEQALLARYTGWGAPKLKEFFSDYSFGSASPYDQRMKARRDSLRGLLTDEEWSRMRESILNAHYTFDLYREMYEALQHHGFEGGNVLEPAVGSGHAFGLMPAQMMKNSRLTGVEIDPITAQIASALYPNADIQQTGYEESLIASNTQDLAISNVPFGEFSVADQKMPSAITKSIHNYFFGKALSHVRPGGLVM